MHPDRSHLKERAKAGVRHFLIMFAYLLLIFTLFQLHEYVILREHGLPYTRFGFGLIKALVLAKVMLIGDEMKLGRKLSAQPIAYAVAGRSALFALLFIAFDLLEQVVRALLTGKGIAESVAAPGGGLLPSCIVAAIMCVMLVPYFAFVELVHARGSQEVKRMLFGSMKSERVSALRKEPTVG